MAQVAEAALMKPVRDLIVGGIPQEHIAQATKVDAFRGESDIPDIGELATGEDLGEARSQIVELQLSTAIALHPAELVVATDQNAIFGVDLDGSNQFAIRQGMQLPLAAIEFQQAVGIAHVDDALAVLGNCEVLRVDVEIGLETGQRWRA